MKNAKPKNAFDFAMKSPVFTKSKDKWKCKHSQQFVQKLYNIFFRAQSMCVHITFVGFNRFEARLFDVSLLVV